MFATLQVTAPWLTSPSSRSRVRRPALLANDAYPAIESHANFCADMQLSAVRKRLQIVAYIRGRLRGTLPGHSVAIAIGTVTHLLLAGPVKLPLLGGVMPLLESVCL